MIRIPFAILLLAAAVTAAVCQEERVRIDVIDFFGYSKINLAPIRAALPIHEKTTLTLRSERDAQDLKDKVKQAVLGISGDSPTDIAFVCCTKQGGWMFYIGLPGKSYRPFTYKKPPVASIRLPTEGIDVYQKSLDALSQAVQTGGAEDDSKGYALSTDPTLRAAQLAERRYATNHEQIIRRVLSSSADVPSRQAASALLGYASQSQGQINNLVGACRDPDSTVRNNALRALAVVASSSKEMADSIPAKDFIEMMNSGTWSDRNKGGVLLMQLTTSRNPRVMRELDEDARESLTEMARWQETGHAIPFRVLLGRIAGIDEARLQKIVYDSDQVETIISALPARR